MRGENLKVVIVGGVAAGASTAARLRRLDEGAQIIMFERGEDISFANCGLPYYIGGVIEKRKRLLVQTPKAMRDRFNIDVRTMSEVQKIMPEEKEVEVKNLLTGEIYRESYDYLVLCPGAGPIMPDIKGVDLPNVFTVRNIPDSDIIKQYVEEKKPAKAVVVGGGFIGLEMAEMLHGLGIEAAIVEAAPQVMGALDPEMAAIVHRYLRRQGVKLCLSSKLVGMEGSSQVERVILENGETLDTDIVIMGIGVRPEVWLAKEAGLAVGSTGGILVDDCMRTSDPFIYAAGDAVEVKDFVTGEKTLVPLAGPANRQGWVVANNIASRDVKYNGVQGTAIVKIMDMVVAVTGKNEKSLSKLGRDYLTCHIHPNSHATYYPGSTQMTLKLLFSPGEGQILGAQIVGYDGVDKRIDVLATAVRAKMTVYDLQELELAYAPPFSSAKDPVNMAGYVAANILQKAVQVVPWEEVPERVAGGAFLIDVRAPKEVEKGGVEGACNISVDELRARMDEIPKDKEILVFCQVGLRAYIAARILAQNGYDVKNIDGGYKLYRELREN
ncbi:MAG: pyridine nucleotide-disulfide oxidoreductase family protein [Syntrophomonadaceae bacterium]|nr:pyridine nucleotide-disulfide oxidoreductase family protein [Syntrophomonadaceae bacterium]